MYELIVGLEIHVQPKTKSKMFCRCDSDYFGDEPNTHVCPVCLGLPGALPVPNKEAIRKCVKLGLALGCKINKESYFERKHYFYPDLPKGYQISQNEKPFCYDGSLIVVYGQQEKKVHIKRVHMEEDAGKSVHKGDLTLLDYNKSGMPLIEIVTEPDFRNVEEVTAFATRLRQIVRYVGISDADMEKGQMRFELNISLRPKGSDEYPTYKVEVKNIGSISVLEKVLKFEITRQREILERGETPLQETRGLKDMSGETLSQRVKEESQDYRYFPEPDIPPIELDDDYIESIMAEIPELPDDKKSRYIQDYGLSDEIAENIVADVDKATTFEQLIENVEDTDLVQEVAKWFVGPYLALTNEDDLPHSNFDVFWLVDIAKMVQNGKINKTVGQDVLEHAYREGVDPTSYVSDNNLEIIQDSSAIEQIVDKAIQENPKVVEDFKKNPNAAMFIVGVVMREMRGKADAKIVKELVFNKLSSK